MKPILPFILLVVLTGCVTRKACERKFPNIEHDSVSVVSKTVTVIRDTTIYVKIPGDTIFGSVPVSEVSTLTTGVSTSTALVKDGMIQHRMEQRDNTVAATLKGALRTSRRDVAREKIVYRTKYINQLSGWQWFQVWVGRVLGGAVAMLVVYRLVWRKV